MDSLDLHSDVAQRILAERARMLAQDDQHSD